MHRRIAKSIRCKTIREAIALNHRMIGIISPQRRRARRVEENPFLDFLCVLRASAVKLLSSHASKGRSTTASCPVAGIGDRLLSRCPGAVAGARGQAGCEFQAGG